MDVKDKMNNKTKVLSVQLGKTLGLTKVPITETEESTQVQKNLDLNFFDPKVGWGGVGGLQPNSLVCSVYFIS